MSYLEFNYISKVNVRRETNITDLCVGLQLVLILCVIRKYTLIQVVKVFLMYDQFLKNRLQARFQLLHDLIKAK